MTLRIINSTFLVICLLAGMYFSVSGYLAIELNASLQALKDAKTDTTVMKVGDVTYASMIQYNLIKDKNTLQETFPYLKGFPDTFCMIVSALSFGLLGSITLLFRELAFDSKVTIINARVFSIPFLGMLSGLFILGLTYLVPTILVSGEQNVRPEVLIFLSLFAGLFCNQFYEWLHESFDRIFPSNPKEQSNV